MDEINNELLKGIHDLTENMKEALRKGDKSFREKEEEATREYQEVVKKVKKREAIFAILTGRGAPND